MSIDWTAQTWTANGVIWILSIWKGVGWSFIIFLAALDGIPRQLLESARIDGAPEPKVWRHVVLPSIRGAVTFVTVLLVIGAAQVFTQIYRDHQGRTVQFDAVTHDLYVPAGLLELRLRLRRGVWRRSSPSCCSGSAPPRSAFSASKTSRAADR